MNIDKIKFQENPRQRFPYQNEGYLKATRLSKTRNFPLEILSNAAFSIKKKKKKKIRRTELSLITQLCHNKIISHEQGPHTNCCCQILVLKTSKMREGGVQFRGRDILWPYNSTVTCDLTSYVMD